MSDNYGDADFIREMTDVPRSETSDSELVKKRDKLAIPRVNEDVMTEHSFEELKDVSNEKSNEVDGSNKTFYLRELHRNRNFLGDLDDDGEVSGSDVEVQYERQGEIIGSNNFDVAVVDDYTGKIQIEFKNDYTFENGDSVSAGDAVPGEGDLYISRYRTCPARVKDASHNLRKASAFLTAYYAYSRIEVRKLKSFSLDNVSISKQSEADEAMLRMYKKEVEKIIQREVIQSRKNRNSADGAIHDKIKRRRTIRGSGHDHAL